MRRTITLLFLSLSLLSAQIVARPAASQSEPDTLRYISDVLVINIRDQLEKPYSVIGVVRTGDPVRIVEDRENYFKIETADKKQGWIGKQYLKREIPDSITAQQLRQEVSELKKQLAEMVVTQSTHPDSANPTSAVSCADIQQKLSNAEKQLQELQEKKSSSIPHSSSEAASQLQEQNLDITTQLEQTSQRYNQLIAEYEKRGKEIADLQNSLAKKDDLTRFFWFGVGAVVFFLGLLAGKSAGRKRNKLRY